MMTIDGLSVNRQTLAVYYRELKAEPDHARSVYDASCIE